MQNRTGTPAPGDSAAYLAEVQKRVTLIHDPHVEPIPVPGDDAGNARLRLAFEDASRLLAALEAVLALHRPDGLHGERQPDGQWAGHVRCWQATCPDEWPCPTYEAISAVLLGKSAAS